MNASIAALYGYPIKGFSPQPLACATLAAGQTFPGDRRFAVEDGPSGFDPAAPVFIPKQKFAVLAKIAEVAGVRTQLDPTTLLLNARAQGAEDFNGRLTDTADQSAFAGWLTDVLGDAADGPLRLIDGAGHHFTDHPIGQVSIINLASLRDLESRMQKPVDPMRFRANIYLEGLEPWAEMDWLDQSVALGEAVGTVFSTTIRCAATTVNPATALRDLEVPAALHEFYGHVVCGVYLKVTQGGLISVGDPVRRAASDVLA